MKQPIQMMMMNRTILFLIFLVLPAAAVLAQGDDFGIWTEVSVRHGIVKNVRAEVTGGIRTFNNSSQIEQYFVEGGLSYDLSKNISISGLYRLISNIEDDSKYYFRHRLSLDVDGTLPVRNFSFTARARIQRLTRTYIENEEDLSADYYGRLKMQVSYKIPSLPLEPFVYYEPSVPLFAGEGFSIARSRFSAGTDLRISRKSSMEAAWLFQRDFSPRISDINVVSLKYKLKF